MAAQSKQRDEFRQAQGAASPGAGHNILNLSEAGRLKPAFSFVNEPLIPVNARVRIWTEADFKLAQAKPKIAHKLGRVPTYRDPALALDRNVGLALASTQPKKFTEFNEGLRPTNASIKVLDAIEILSWFLSADEVSGTFEGNAYEKAEKLLNRIYNYMGEDKAGYDRVAGILKEKGYSPDRIVFAVNDCGFSFNQDFSGEPEFQRSMIERGITKSWPDVELGPVMDAQGGIRQFYDDLVAMVQRKREAGEEVDLTGLDKSIYIFFKLKPHREDVQLVSSYAEVPIEVSLQARPDDGIMNYPRRMMPQNHDLPAHMRGKTMEEIGDEYWRRYSAQAVAISSFVKMTGVQQTSAQEFERASKIGNKGKFRVATLNNVIEGLKTKEPPFESKIFRTKMKPANIAVDTLERGAYQRINQDTEGFVLGQHGNKILRDPDAYFLDRADLWCSLIVDKQLRVETSENKLLEVIDGGKPFKASNCLTRDQEMVAFLKGIDPAVNPWLPFIEFTRYLNESGFVKQEMQYLFTQHDPAEPMLGHKILKKVKENAAARQPTLPDYETEFFGQDETEKYEVTVLGSASTRVEQYIKQAEDLGYWMASMGFHVRTGGGRYGIMGAVSRGVKKFMSEYPHLAAQCHLSAIQMPRTIQFEGVDILPDECAASNNKFLKVETSFDNRIASLLRSDSCVAMAPGIGTYQEIIRQLRLKHNGVQVPNKMTLFNHERANEQCNARIMDVFLQGMLPDRYRALYSEVNAMEALKAHIIDEYIQKRGYAPVPLLERLRYACPLPPPGPR